MVENRRSDPTTPSLESQSSKPRGNEITEMMSQMTPLSHEEVEAIIELIPIRNFKKGTILLREGQISNGCYINLKGCVRQYYLIDGEEKTTDFFTEGQGVTSADSSINRTPAKHYFACVEDCRLGILTVENEMELYRRFPRFERYCRIGVEEELAKNQEKLARYITSSPEQRYAHLLETRPELIDRVPQYQLASYLGVTPESLSRIRKRIMKKK